MKLEREFNELTDLIIDEGYGMTENGSYSHVSKPGQVS